MLYSMIQDYCRDLETWKVKLIMEKIMTCEVFSSHGIVVKCHVQ